MAKRTTTFTADASTLIGIARKPRNSDYYIATIFVFGSTFGSGTMAIQVSPDHGTTKITATNSAGTAQTATANAVLNIQLGVGNNNTDYIEIYGTLTGSTNPSLTVSVWDGIGY